MPEGTEPVVLLEDRSPVPIVFSSCSGLYYEVNNLDREVKRFCYIDSLSLGKPAPAAAFNGRRIVFLLTPQRDLIELLDGAGS